MVKTIHIARMPQHSKSKNTQSMLTPVFICGSHDITPALFVVVVVVVVEISTVNWAGPPVLIESSQTLPHRP
jgi:hypothetical protein